MGKWIELSKQYLPTESTGKFHKPQETCFVIPLSQTPPPTHFFNPTHEYLLNPVELLPA